TTSWSPSPRAALGGGESALFPQRRRRARGKWLGAQRRDEGGLAPPTPARAAPPPPRRGPPPPALRLGEENPLSSLSAEGAPGGSGSARSDETKGGWRLRRRRGRRPLHHVVVPLPLRCAWGRRIRSLPSAPKARPGEVARREATRRRGPAPPTPARAAPPPPL